MRLWLCSRHFTASFSACRFLTSSRLVGKIRSSDGMLISRNSETGCFMLSELQAWRILLQSKCEFFNISVYMGREGEGDNGCPSFSTATIAEMSSPCAIARFYFLIGCLCICNIFRNNHTFGAQNC